MTRATSLAKIAVQGPVSKEIMLKLCEERALPEKYYSFTKTTPTWKWL